MLLQCFCSALYVHIGGSDKVHRHNGLCICEHLYVQEQFLPQQAFIFQLINGCQLFLTNARSAIHHIYCVLRTLPQIKFSLSYKIIIFIFICTHLCVQQLV